MTNLASFSVLKERVDKIHIEEPTETKGQAFMRLALETILKLNDDEIEEAITDGPMDGEIDAISIDEKTIHIFTFKYTDSFDNTKKAYPETELDQFILTVDLIISGNLDKAAINTAVWDKYQEIRVLASQSRIDFKIYVVSNKLEPADHAKRKLENAIDKFRIVDKPVYFDQERIVSQLLENKATRINGSLKFVDTQHFEKSNGNIRTIVGAISANDLIELIKKKDGSNTINEDIFNENVRVYKPAHRINKAIIASAEASNNFQFFYLNNGITILCEEVKYTPFQKSPVVELKDIQIINGGQTSHSLFEVFKSSNADKLNSVELLVRICESRKDNPISDLISETSNSQIPVGSRDLHSNDSIQRKLEEQFLALEYYYERKPSQYSDKPKDQVLNNELLGQLYMSYHLDMPSEAKNSKSKVFSEQYDLIFDENKITAKELIKLHKLYQPILAMKKKIQSKKRKKEPIEESMAFISRATFHILNGLKLLFEKEEAVIDAKQISSAEKAKEKEEIYNSKREEFTQKVIEIIFERVEIEMENRGDVYTHDKFFKEIPTNGIMKSYISGIINSI
jgi:hypothetical protein